MKQHPLCTDTEQVANVLDLAIPARVKQEWAELQTRRHFLGRAGKVLGWAAVASLLGDRALRGDELPGSRRPGRRLAEASELCAQGQARDLSLHVRRPFAG